MARNMYTIHSVTKILFVFWDVLKGVLVSTRIASLERNVACKARVCVASDNAMLIQRTNVLDVMYVSVSECAVWGATGHVAGGGTGGEGGQAGMKGPGGGGDVGRGQRTGGREGGGRDPGSWLEAVLQSMPT